MKHRLIAIFLLLMMLSVLLVTAVFAAPDDEPEVEAEPVVTTTEAPVQTDAPTPVETDPPVTAEPTEPAAAPTQPQEPQQQNDPGPSDDPVETDPDDQIVSVSCTLTITRPAPDDEQDFLYVISGGERTIQVLLPRGMSSITVTGLQPDITYTVSEDQSWSWRYTAPSGLTQHVTFTATNNEKTLSFTSERVNENWVSDSARGDG